MAIETRTVLFTSEAASNLPESRIAPSRAASAPASSEASVLASGPASARASTRESAVGRDVAHRVEGQRCVRGIRDQRHVVLVTIGERGPIEARVERRHRAVIAPPAATEDDEGTRQKPREGERQAPRSAAK